MHASEERSKKTHKEKIAMPKKLYKEAPKEYAICWHSDCPRAATCLHQLACQPLMEEQAILRLINPNHCTKDEHCPYYRDSSPVTYARGFTNMQKRMFPDQYQTFMSILMKRFGRTPYFERRRGEIAMPPKEQEIVLRALRQAGVTEDLKFDQYEENVNWHE